MFESIIRIFDPADRFVFVLLLGRWSGCGASARGAVRNWRAPHGADAQVRPDRVRSQYYYEGILMGGAPPRSRDAERLEGNARKFAVPWP